MKRILRTLGLKKCWSMSSRDDCPLGNASSNTLSHTLSTCSIYVLYIHTNNPSLMHHPLSSPTTQILLITHILFSYHTQTLPHGHITPWGLDSIHGCLLHSSNFHGHILCPTFVWPSSRPSNRPNRKSIRRYTRRFIWKPFKG